MFLGTTTPKTTAKRATSYHQMRSLALFSLIPNKDFDCFLSLFGEIIDRTEFGFYDNDKNLGLDFKTGIRNGMRSAILCVEQHIPFKNKISFREEKIVFKVHYRDIKIEKSVSENNAAKNHSDIWFDSPSFHAPISTNSFASN
jgi:hypothetical protein